MAVELSPDWHVTYVYRDGVLAGAFAVRDNEIHCERHPAFTGRWATRQDFERVAGPLLRQYGFVRTKVRESNETGHRFVTRLGFIETSRSNGLRHYEAKRINHARL